VQRTTPDRSISWRSPFLVIFALIFAGFWTVTGTLLVVDPLDLYAWGRPPQLLDDYHRGDTAYLYSAVSRAELDTLFIGSSTTAIFSSSDLQQAFPGARRAFNLSVSGPRPYDRALLSNLVLEHSPARHLLLAVDWFYVQPARQAKPDVPVYLYDEDALNDLRVASPTALRLLLRRLQGGPLALPGWDYAASSHGDDEQRWRQFQRADKLAEIRRAVTATRDLLAADSNPGCSGYDALQLQLLPFIRKASSQGRQLDLVIPPYSLAFYAVSELQPRLGGHVLAHQLALRRCLVDAVDGLPGVRVYAFDDETWITGDLANYGDEGHIYNEAIKRYLLAAIADGSHRLTRANIGEYVATLRANVLNYEPHNSALERAER